MENKSVSQQIRHGVYYTAINKYGSMFISLLIGSVLSRILSPAEYGIVGVVNVFIVFFGMLADFGLGPAIVQNKNLSNADMRSIFGFSIYLALLFGLVFYSSATLIAKFYNNGDLKNVARLLTVSVIFSSLSIVPNALLLKKHGFRKTGLLSLAIQVLTGILGIGMAYKGFSYYSLVTKSVCGSVLSFAVLFYYAPVIPLLKLKLEAIKKIFRFSTYQFLFGFVNYFSRNLDNLLVGKYLGPEALGFYGKSYFLISLPLGNITHVITPVILPVLSRFQDDKKYIYNSYLKLTKMLALIGFPLSAFLFWAAPDIIYIMYGSQWANSVPVFKILALSIGFQMVTSSSGSIFQTVGRTDLLFMSGMVHAVILVTSICLGIFVGKSLVAVGIGVAIGFIVSPIQAFYFLIIVCLKQPIRLFFMDLIVPLLLFFSCILLSFIVDPYLNFNHFISLGIKSLVVLGVCWLIISLWPEERKNLEAIFRKIFGKRAAAPAIGKPA